MKEVSWVRDSQVWFLKTQTLSLVSHPVGYKTGQLYKSGQLESVSFGPAVVLYFQNQEATGITQYLFLGFCSFHRGQGGAMSPVWVLAPVLRASHGHKAEICGIKCMKSELSPHRREWQ